MPTRVRLCPTRRGQPWCPLSDRPVDVESMNNGAGGEEARGCGGCGSCWKGLGQRSGRVFFCCRASGEVLQHRFSGPFATSVCRVVSAGCVCVGGVLQGVVAIEPSSQLTYFYETALIHEVPCLCNLEQTHTFKFSAIMAEFVTVIRASHMAELTCKKSYCQRN